MTREAAALLADAANKRLSAGVTREDVLRAWPPARKPGKR